MPIKTAQYREMSPAEMDKEEKEIRAEIWKLQLQRSTGQMQDPGKLKGAKKDLARLLTTRREKEIASERGAAPDTE